MAGENIHGHRTTSPTVESLDIQTIPVTDFHFLQVLL